MHYRMHCQYRISLDNIRGFAFILSIQESLGNLFYFISKWNLFISNKEKYCTEQKTTRNIAVFHPEWLQKPGLFLRIIQISLSIFRFRFGDNKKEKEFVIHEMAIEKQQSKPWIKIFPTRNWAKRIPILKVKKICKKSENIPIE